MTEEGTSVLSSFCAKNTCMDGAPGEVLRTDRLHEKNLKYKGVSG